MTNDSAPDLADTVRTLVAGLPRSDETVRALCAAIVAEYGAAVAVWTREGVEEQLGRGLAEVEWRRLSDSPEWRNDVDAAAYTAAIEPVSWALAAADVHPIEQLAN